MAQITTLKDKDGKSLYPITSSKAVFDENGIDVDTKLAGKVDKVQGKVLSSNDYTTADKNKLSQLPTNTELETQLASKQNALSTTDDLAITDNELSLTDMAKKRLFIDLWNTACGKQGIYNKETGYFELSYLKDITYEEALEMYYVTYNKPLYRNAFEVLPNTIRAILPIFPPYGSMSADSFFKTTYVNTKLELIPAWNVSSLSSTKLSSCFMNLAGLKRVEGNIFIGNTDNTANMFKGCTSLEYVNFGYVRSSIDISASSYIRFEMLQQIVSKGDVKYNVIITVHVDVYAKLTGDTTNDAYNNLTDEEKTQWTSLLELAAEKNIQFATS